MEIKKSLDENDVPALANMIQEAFAGTDHGYSGESELVTALRKSDRTSTYDFVAWDAEMLVGYALLSDALIIDDEQPQASGLVLAPLAVAPVAQKQGVGKALMSEIETVAKKHGYSFISILGGDYYRQFGYKAASQFGIEAPMEVPDEYFQIKPMREEGLTDVHGTLKYAPEFGI
ncbi:N-acetyltransferase [uncultured Weissella sp.]|uniref:GNAT family N-acetyltransferase n=1 Tax=uncultured Weissella sp. TaxID=253243 RepID=UPI0027DE19CD|nr:N-acetyltransferase [uncultured Weissella sp.]